jgi:hypothetical protein
MTYDLTSTHPLSALVRPNASDGDVPAGTVATEFEKVYRTTSANIAAIRLPNTMEVRVYDEDGNVDAYAYDADETGTGAGILTDFDNRKFVLSVPTGLTGDQGPAGTDQGVLAVEAANLLQGHAGIAIHAPSNSYAIRNFAGTSVTGDTLDNLGTFARASSTTAFDANGVLQTIATGVQAFDHDPMIGQGARLQLAAGVTNLDDNPNDASTDWTLSGLTVTANSADGPDGNTTADKLVATSGTSNKEQSQTYVATTTNNRYYSWTRSFKADGYGFAWMMFTGTGVSDALLGASINLSDGTIATPTGMTAPAKVVKRQLIDGYWRLEIIVLADAVGTLIGYSGPSNDGLARSFNGDGTSGVLVCNTMAVAGYGCEPFVSTTSAISSLTIPLSDLPTIGSEFTIFGKMRLRNSTLSGSDMLNIIDGSNRVTLNKQGTYANKINAFVQSSAGSTFSLFNTTGTDFDLDSDLSFGLSISDARKESVTSAGGVTVHSKSIPGAPALASGNMVFGSLFQSGFSVEKFGFLTNHAMTAAQLNALTGSL